METEVVVKLDEGLLHNLENLARSRGKTISELVADFVNSMVVLSRPDGRQSPILSEISGVLRSNSQVTEKEYKIHLMEKYL